MEKYNKFVNKSNELKEAINWINNKNKRDSQSSKPYSLHNISFSADYCGQAYAGANNYHTSPKEFNAYMSKVIRDEYELLFNKAIKLMKEDVKQSLIDADEEITAIKNKIENIKLVQV